MNPQHHLPNGEHSLTKLEIYNHLMLASKAECIKDLPSEPSRSLPLWLPLGISTQDGLLIQEDFSTVFTEK